VLHVTPPEVDIEPAAAVMLHVKEFAFAALAE
jgi:hypothetical protein